MKKPEKIALAAFNSISMDSNEYWGNTVCSALSGELSKLGVRNDLFLLLMLIGEAERNNKTLAKFVERIRAGGYTMVIFESLWLPEIMDMLRDAAPHTAVVLKKDLVDGFLEKHEEIKKAFSVISRPDFTDKRRMPQPNFKYIKLGTSKKTKQTLVDMWAMSPMCYFQENLEENPYYDSLCLEERRKYRGCGYCSAPTGRAGMDAETQSIAFVYFMKYFQKHLPALTRVSLPSPEGFFDTLIDVAPHLTSGEFRPVGFQMQLRPDVIVNLQDKIRKILEVYSGSGMTLHLATVGFENFSKKELGILHRGYAPQALTQALEIIKSLIKDYPETLDMSRSIASFILFNPYTTIKDIKENLAMISEHDFSCFFDININKVRIYPGVGLYALVEHDGLLDITNKAQQLSDLPRGGYQGDYGYIFKEEKVAAAYRSYAEAERAIPELFRKNKIYILKKIVEHMK